MTGTDDLAPAPALRVVRGRPTEEEVAALLVVLTARAPAQPPPAPEVSAWASYARAIGAPPLPGPGAWQASGRTG
ncbi:MAG: acyl-CoA carboxylase subunit epsilon [Friedmanniella sp.]